MFEKIKIGKVVRKTKKTTAERLTLKRGSAQVRFQQGFSAEGQDLLSRLWIKQEPEPKFEDFTLARFIEGKNGYKWQDES